MRRNLILKPSQGGVSLAIKGEIKWMKAMYVYGAQANRFGTAIPATGMCVIEKAANIGAGRTLRQCTLARSVEAREVTGIQRSRQYKMVQQ